MSNNEIALSFDTLEYYSLQEASEYLNRKYKTDNIKPKKLLKLISSRKINTFINFRMDNLSKNPLRVKIKDYNSNVFPDEIYSLSEEEVKPILKISNQLEKRVSNGLIDDLYMGFILFRVDEYSLFNLAMVNNLQDSTPLLLIEGFVYNSSHNDDPYKPKQLDEWAITVKDKIYRMLEINTLSFVIDSTNDDDLSEFIEKYPYLCSFDKRDGFSFIKIYINIDNLIILHKDLLRVEEEVINNKPIENRMGFEPRKGISKKKILAKEFAKHTAIEHWKRDIENNIKIGEMCEIVWSKLIDAGFDTELPNHTINLKPWIKEVSPSYASEAGRPQS